MRRKNKINFINSFEFFNCHYIKKKHEIGNSIALSKQIAIKKKKEKKKGKMIK